MTSSGAACSVIVGPDEKKVKTEVDQVVVVPSSPIEDTQEIKPVIPETDPEPVLSAQQQTILKKIIDGKNYFFTGSAGTGKSVLLRAIIKAFRDRAGEGQADRAAMMEKQWQTYLEAGARGVPPVIDVVNRWQLGVTASTGMAGV